MKIACQSCGAKYTIADEKVSGKTVKIKCKKCGATVVVDGHAHADAGGTPDDGSRGATGDEWTVSVADDDQRSLTTPQVAAEYQRGVVTADTFVWRDGMPEWLALAAVPELWDACSAAAGGIAAPPTEAIGAAAGGYGYGGAPAAAAAAASTPFAAMPAATAARTKQRAQVDLFGAGGGGGAASADAAPAAGSSIHIGERNENSVLFSLSALTAAETAAKKSSSKPSPRGGMDFSSNRPGPGKASSIDDIMNLGSGSMNTGGSLAPPPINAPFIEPPPPPPPPVSMHPGAMMNGPPSQGYGGQAHGAQGHAMQAMPMGMPYEQQQPKKAPVGLIAGGLVGVMALAGAAFFLGRGSDADAEKTVATEKPAITEPAKKDEPVADAKADEAKADEAKPADDAKPEGDAKPADDTKPAEGSGAVAGTGRPAPTTGGAAPPTTAKKDDPKKDEPKKEEPKKEEPAASATGSFDRGAAQAALGSAAGGARGCKKDGGPTGSTKVQVTFAPSGRVTTVNVGSPFAGTPVGSCIAGSFKGLSVPAFSGSPVTVSKTVSIK